MKISDQLRQAVRQLGPAQQTELGSLHDKIDAIEDELAQARAALEKWQLGERYDPQKNNLQHSLKAIMQSARAALTFADKL